MTKPKNPCQNEFLTLHKCQKYGYRSTHSELPLLSEQMKHAVWVPSVSLLSLGAGSPTEAGS